MFPLTDSSILLLALLMIAFFGLGFMVLMGILIFKIFDRNHTTVQTAAPPTPMPRQPDANQPDQLVTNIGIWGLAIAFIAIAQGQYLSGHIMGTIVLYIFAGILTALGFPRVRQVIRIRQVRWFFYGFVVVLAILAILNR